MRRLGRCAGLVLLVSAITAACGTEPSAVVIGRNSVDTTAPAEAPTSSASVTESSAVTTVPASGAPETTTPDTEAPPPTIRPASTSATPTTAAPTTAAPSNGAPLVLDVLRTIPVELEHSSGYSRDLFVVWADLDGDGCDTRQEVLRAESLDLVQADPSGCPIVAGRWYSVYDGLTFEDPSELDIDHVVALKEAWDSGAWAWTSVQRIAYANDQSDPRTLVAVSASSNRSKGDRDPSNWLPPVEDPCRYVADWVAIKARWSLSMDQSEWGRIKNLLQGPCIGTTID